MVFVSRELHGSLSEALPEDADENAVEDRADDRGGDSLPRLLQKEAHRKDARDPGDHAQHAQQHDQARPPRGFHLALRGEEQPWLAGDRRLPELADELSSVALGFLET